MESQRTSLIIQVVMGALLLARPATAAQAGAAEDTVRLTLQEARARAISASPAYLAEAERVGSAEGALRDAGAFRFNPEAEAEFPGSLSGDGEAAYELRLTQRLEWGGQRGLRRDVANAALEGARSTLEESRTRLIAAVTEAHYVALAANRRLALAQDVAGLNQRLLEAVRMQLEEGEISVMEANFVQIEAARSVAQVLTAGREARSASLTLARLVGAPEVAVVQATEGAPEALPDTSLLDLDRLVAAAMTLRPDVRALTHRVRQSETLVRLARRERIPNVGAGALITGGGGEPTTGVGLQVSMTLPLWNRSQGIIAQREADARRSSYELDEAGLSVRIGVADAYQAYVAASEEEALIVERVLEPARSNQELLDAAYREGELDLPSLVLLRNQLWDAEVSYWDAWLARRRALSSLYAAVGDFSVDLEAP